MEFGDVLRTRRSSRHFGDEPVARETIAELVEAARWSPSAGNRQPWRVEALAPGAARKLVAAVEPLAWEILYPTLREVIARDTSVLGRSPTGAELTDATVAFVQREIFLRGNFWLLVVHFPRHTLAYNARNIASTAEFFAHRIGSRPGVVAKLELASFLAGRAPHAIENDVVADLGSVAGFMYALALAATDRGLDSCIQYSFGLVERELRGHLGLDDSADVIGAIAIGHPVLGSVGRAAPRKPVAVRWHDDDGGITAEPVGS